MNTVTIDINEYNELRDFRRDISEKGCLFYTWNGKQVYTLNKESADRMLKDSRLEEICRQNIKTSLDQHIEMLQKENQRLLSLLKPETNKPKDVLKDTPNILNNIIVVIIPVLTFILGYLIK